jgi:hypothetical protein
VHTIASQGGGDFKVSLIERVSMICSVGGSIISALMH